MSAIITAVITWVPIALISILALIVIVNVITSIFKGLKRSIGKLIAVILSAIAAGIITSLVCKPDSMIINWLVNTVKSVIPEGAIMDILNIEELGLTLSYYITMLVAPIFFMLTFILINIIFSIILGIIFKLLPIFKDIKPAANKLGGAGVGLVCGLLIAILVLAPITGTIDMVSSVGQVQLPGSETEESQLSFLTDLAESPSIKIINMMGGSMVYNFVANADFAGQKVYLKNDVDAIVDIVNSIQLLGVDMSEYDQTQIEALEKVIEDVDKSPLLEHTIAGVFSDASTAWLEGEQFIGVDKFSAGELLDPIVDSVLLTMTTSTKDNISDDLTTLKDVFATLINNDLLDMSGDYQAMLVSIGENDVITELLNVVNKNARMSHIADDITSLSVRALASTLGIPKDAQERYDMLMTDIADVLEGSANLSGDERLHAVTPEIVGALSDYGVYVSGEAASGIAESLIEDLGDLSVVESSDIEEFFTVYAIASDNLVARSNGRYSFENLSSKKSGKSGKNSKKDNMDVVVNDDGTVSVNGVILKNYSADKLYNSGAYNKGQSGVDFEDAAFLYSYDTMKSTLVTMEDVLSEMSNYCDVEDMEKEAALIGEIVSEAAKTFGNMDFENADISEIIESFGGLLDKMSESSIFSGKSLDNLLTAALQSDKVTEATGLSHKEVTEFAGNLNSMVKTTDKSYKDATTTVSKVITVVNNCSDSNKNNDEKSKSVEELINNISKETADLIASLVTPSYMIKNGVPEKQSVPVSDMIVKLLKNMGAYEGDNSKGEADAVSQVLMIALTTSNDKSLFSDDANEGELGVRAEEFVDIVVNSEVISQTLEEIVYKDGKYNHNPLDLDELSESDAKQITEALTEYYEKHGQDQSLVRKLVAIGSMMNVRFDVIASYTVG